MSVKSLSALFCAIFLLCSHNSSLLAEDIKADSILVTATRGAQTIDETLASVTIITRKDLEHKQPQDLLEVFRNIEGIDVSRTGGAGSDTSLFLRGTDSDHLLVLIDGVRAASATSGKFAWANLPVSQIERIEIVRGPRASLYGSDAIGGVIQIFTRKTQGQTVSLEIGEFGTRAVQLGYGGSSEKVKYHFNITSRDVEGFSAKNANGFSFDPDKDGYENFSLSGGATMPFGDKLKLELNLLHSDGEVEFDQGVTETTNRVLNASFSGDKRENWHQTLSLGVALDQSETDSAFASEITTRHHSIDWQHDLSINSGALVTVGLNYFEDQGESIDKITSAKVYDKSIYNSALYVNWQRNLEDVDILIGGRNDKHNKFGSHATGQLAFGTSLSEKIRLWASYGTAFRAPSLDDLYHPGFGGFFAGNPNLEPEKSKTIELGLQSSSALAHRFNISIYENKVENLIQLLGVNSQAINIGNAIMQGIEAGYSTKQGLWQYQTNLTWQKARNDDDGTHLLRRPDSKVSFAINREFSGGSALGADLLLSSSRVDFGGVNLPGYGLMNLNYHMPLKKHFMLEGRIENLLDKDYELASGFNMSERALYAGIRYHP